ncbi:MAG: hypothetical protein WC758_06950 [Candidatus Woesearchaeota archaeon]|jgi:hypothetical protein
MDENVELGGKISLSGFKELKPAELVVAKKLIGSYARKFADSLENYESLHIYLKAVHKTPGSEKYEIHGKLLFNGNLKVSEVIDRNLFVALDNVLKKLEILSEHI